MDEKITQLLTAYFGSYETAFVSGGATQASLFKIKSRYGGRYILKQQTASLRNDYLNYQWLHGKIAVPEVIFYQSFEAFEVLCVQLLEGQTLDMYKNKMGPKATIERYAQTLRQLHALPIDAHALVQNLDKKLEKAAYNIDNQLIELMDLEPENRDTPLPTLLEQLRALRPKQIEAVFTHGDYCLDNLLFEGHHLSGLIDIGNGGVADKYQDIALAVRTIRGEWGAKWVSFFLDIYGLKDIDIEKTRFYTLLDEFF